MTYLYKIGYGSHEESDFVELSHDKLFTKADISQMVAEAIAAIEPKWKAENQKLIDHAESEDRSALGLKREPQFDDMWSGWHYDDGIPRWLVANKGFVRILYDVEWCANGWAEIHESAEEATRRLEQYGRDELDDVRDHLKTLQKESK